VRLLAELVTGTIRDRAGFGRQRYCRDACYYLRWRVSKCNTEGEGEVVVFVLDFEQNNVIPRIEV
jgi:hypothetical protein